MTGRHILLVFFILMFFTACVLVKDSKKKDNCSAYTYDVIEGDSVRFVKKCCK